jgi:hypothetical protein
VDAGAESGATDCANPSSTDAKWKADSRESVRLLQGYFASQADEGKEEGKGGGTDEGKDEEHATTLENATGTAAGVAAAVDTKKRRPVKRAAMKATDENGRTDHDTGITNGTAVTEDPQAKSSYLRWPAGASDRESAQHVQKQKRVQVRPIARPVNAARLWSTLLLLLLAALLYLLTALYHRTSSDRATLQS